MVGWIGDPPADLMAHLFMDADFAGCPYTLRSTSGLHGDIQGPNSRYPWTAQSHQQTATAQSTPEAELSSLQLGMTSKGEPGLEIWFVLMKRYHSADWIFYINLHEDNSPAVFAVRTGKNPTMKTLERFFGVKLNWITERLERGEHNLIQTRTKDMSADIYTKGFTNPAMWLRLRRLIKV
jgi:hypothetical protein